MEFADRTGMQMNIKKSGLWATTRDQRMRLAGVVVHGSILPLITQDRLLGAYLSYNGQRIRSRFDMTFQACKTIAERIKKMPLPMEVRAILIGSLVVPKAVYACAVNWPSEASMKTLRAKTKSTCSCAVEALKESGREIFHARLGNIIPQRLKLHGLVPLNLGLPPEDTVDLAGKVQYTLLDMPKHRMSCLPADLQPRARWDQRNVRPRLA